MKKKILASAVLSCLAAAQVNAGALAITGASKNVPTEYFGTGSGDTVFGNVVATYTLAADPEGDFNVIVTLDGSATFNTALTGTSLVDANGGGDADGGVSISLVSGGSDTDSTATFRVNNPSGTTGLEAADTLALTFDVDAVNSALATNSGDLEVSFQLSDTLGQLDTNESEQYLQGIDTISGSVTANAAVTGTENTSLNGTVSIDVAQNATDFTTVTSVSTANTVTLGVVGVDVGTAVENDLATGVTLNASDFAVSSFTVTVEGAFDAALNTNVDATSETEGVYLDLDGDDARNANDSEDADTLTATTATFNLTGAESATMVGTDTDVQMVVDGTTQIPESAFTATGTVAYTDATLVGETLFNGSLRTLNKNSQSETFNYVLTPGGNFPQYFRIYNSSTVDGDVFFTLFTDAGDSETVQLSDLTTFDSGNIAAGTVSTLINLDDIYDAAQVIDSTFDAGTDKMRITINGEFPTMDVDTIVLSKDKNSFTLFNN